jgi:hypothetical protein
LNNFLQHFIKILKAGGKAAVVIKNTFLSNTDNASVALRKLLLESCNLHTVLDLPGGTFTGAGVKTVVLFFEKGSATKKVWFYQLNLDRNLGKTNALNEKDLNDFIELQKTKAESENSWKNRKKGRRECARWVMSKSRKKHLWQSLNLINLSQTLHKEGFGLLYAMQILDGKQASNYYQEQLKAGSLEFETKTGKKPHLAAILVGNSGPSETYVAAKMETCRKVGFQSSLIRFEPTITEQQLLLEIDKLNQDPDLHGFIVQLPLPAHIDVNKVIERVDPSKDVDGFHPISVGKMVQGLPTFVPATPHGVMLILEHYQIPTKGKYAVVIGRSNIVGRPMSILLSANTNPGNCTV